MQLYPFHSSVVKFATSWNQWNSAEVLHFNLGHLEIGEEQVRDLWTPPHLRVLRIQKVWPGTSENLTHFFWRKLEGHQSLDWNLALSLNDSRERRQGNEQTGKMADKNLKKNKLEMVCNELKDRIVEGLERKDKKMTEKKEREEKGGHHDN